MNRTRAAASSSLDGLLNFWSVADLKAEFESEIKRLTQIRDDANEKLGIAETVEEAAKIKAEADEYAAKTKGAADAVMVSATSRDADAKLAVERAVSREKSAQAKEAAALKMQDDYSRKDGELSKNTAARDASLTARERAVEMREAKVAAEAQAVAERVRKLDEKIASLQAAKV